MSDFVTYRIPFGIIGKMLHSVLIKKQLKDILSYRSVRIAEWEDGTFQRKGDFMPIPDIMKS
jgi:hypothetical protein